MPFGSCIRARCARSEPDCLTLPFCEAWRCAVAARQGLTGDISHCPVCGIDAVAGYPPRRRK